MTTLTDAQQAVYHGRDFKAAKALPRGGVKSGAESTLTHF
jgi:hypothetical protein